MVSYNLQGEIEKAVRLLREGKTVAFPTETVYGLGADARNPAAIRRIFELKGRPADHPLIVHISSTASLDEWAQDIPAEAWRLAERFWPGPLTLILPRRDAVPLEVTGGQQTVGLRVPDHPLALELLHSFGGGLAAPSANRFGRISPTSAGHVRDELGSQVDMILDGGPCRVGLESTIVSLVGPRPCLLRPGGISAAELSEVLGEELADIPPKTSSLKAPGMLSSHYAPKTPMILKPAIALWSWTEKLAQMGGNLGVMSLTRAPAAQGETARVRHVSMPLQPQAYAQKLYATMRLLDADGYDCLLVEEPPDTSEWQAINNRLRRAAQG